MSFDHWKLSKFLLCQVITKLSDNNIICHNINEVDDTIYFKTSLKYRKKIYEIFPNIVLLKSTGYLSIIYNLWKNKTTIIGLLVAIANFNFLKTRIYKINIKGDYPKIEEKLIVSLQEEGIKKYMPIPNKEKIEEVVDKIYSLYIDELEFFEISNNGFSINVSYIKRRKSIEIDQVKGNMYATKNGIIKYFAIQNGNIVVKRNQYVKQGDLLVSEVLTDSSGNEIFVGCKGKVFANTWHIIEINIPYYKDKAEIDYYLEMIALARNKISLELGEEEYIEAENILQFKIVDSKMVMQVHYTLLEDITI